MLSVGGGYIEAKCLVCEVYGKILSFFQDVHSRFSTFLQ